MYLKHMVCILLPMLSFTHRTWLWGGCCSILYRETPGERFNFSLEIWIIHQDMFSVQDGEFVLAYDVLQKLSAPLQFADAQKVLSVIS